MNPASATLVWCAALAGCAGAASPVASPPRPAVLAGSAPLCTAALAHAARRLTGQSVALAADAFVANDSVVLSTVGQMADGRMTRPTQVLQLRLTNAGCVLGLDGRGETVALDECRCRAMR